MTGLYSADDYTAALRALLPRGRVWPTDAGTTQADVIGCLSPSFAKADSDAIALLADLFPSTTTNFVAEWESALGLPDPCLGPNPTLEQQRDQIVARFLGGGGQSVQRFIEYAATLGFVITVTPYATFRAGRSRVGQIVGNDSWAHTWLVTIVSDATSADHAAFRAGMSKVGDPLESTAAGHAALQCELNAIAPAHTVLLFTY